MQLPIVTAAPLVTDHADIFRDLFENRCQFRHFQNYLTGLIVLENKSMANIARCVLDSADKTNLSRFFSEAPWLAKAVNQRRIAYLLESTKHQRRGANKSALILDDTLCEHVGSLFEYIDRHYNHGNKTYPLAHNLVTSHYVSEAVRFPVDLRMYRRYDECTRWEEFVKKHFPEQEIPKRKKERTRLHKKVDPILLEDPEFRDLHEQFRTKIVLAIELIEKAIEHNLPFSTVLFDGWYLAPHLVEVIEQYNKDWISILKTNRNLETNSFVLRDSAGQPIPLAGSHIKVKQLVPLIPHNAYKAVKIDDQIYYCFTITVRLPSLGKVRIVISFDNPELEGTYAVLVTNRLDWNARHIIALYLQRWPIETFYQDGKQLLGLNEYRMRTAEAIQKHWCLVFVAYSLLHLHCLPASPVKKCTSPIKTIGEVARQQAQSLIQALILHSYELLKQGQPMQDVFTQLFAKQGLMCAS
jgi:SRSO17 transposase